MSCGFLRYETSRAHSPQDHTVPHLYKAKGMLPKFSEDDPEGFFETFEDAAEVAAWPQGHWAIMVRSVLTGKAASVVAAIEKGERGNYERVKEEVLRVYEVTPEFYRDRFRSARKGHAQKYLEYAQGLRKTQGKWWKAAEVETLKQATEVVLVEQFMAGIEPRVRTFLCERRVDSLDEAARLAEDYEINNKPNYSVLPRRGSGRSEGSTRSFGIAKTRCYQCHGTDHLAGSCPKGTDKKTVSATNRSYKPTCYQCGKEGHMASSCPERKEKGQSWRAKVAMCAVFQRKEEKENGEVLSHTSTGKPSGDFEEYQTKGIVRSVDGEGGVPVWVLRDTAADQTLLRLEAAPEGVVRSAGRKMVIRGFGGLTVAKEAMVRLEIAGEERTIRVGLTQDLPVAGVDVLLGNDVGGGKLRSFWKESNQGGLDIHSEDKTVAALTRSHALKEEVERKRQEEEALKALGSIFAETENPGEETGARREDEPRAETEAEIRPEQRCGEGRAGARQAEGPLPEVSSTVNLPATRLDLVAEQRNAGELEPLRADACSPREAEGEASCFVMKDDLLLRRSKDPRRAGDEDEGYQVVLPKCYRQEVVRLAHEDVLAHLGITKTGDVLKRYFWWPGLIADVKRFVKCCRVCQVAQGTAPKPVPLQQIPIVEEPFSTI